MNLLEPLFDSDAARRIDRAAIDQHGVEGYTLMQRAAAAAYATLRTRWPQARRVDVVAGGGNNGGDGIELARLARADGLDCRLLLAADPERLAGEAAQAWAAFVAAGGEAVAPAALGREVDVLVDGLLGTGLGAAVREPLASLIEDVNACRARGAAVLALDVPSGLQVDTGAVAGVAVRADVTVTFIVPKAGLLTGEAPSYTGDLELADLDVPMEARTVAEPVARRITAALVREHLPARDRAAHKGQNGRVVCVGGARRYSGAIRMCAEGALRAGAGLVSVLADAQSLVRIGAGRPELMIGDWENAELLDDMIGGADAVVLGPGMGHSYPALPLLQQVAGNSSLALVLDADGLTQLAQHPMRVPNAIGTPHPGEAARLLRCTVAQVQADRFGAVRRLRENYDGVWVLKGAGTLVYGGEDVPRVCSAGNPGMAVGGTGDVLAGVIGGLLAQGMAPLDAATVGVQVHAMAGDRAAQSGERGLLPSDLIDQLRSVVNPCA